jgi:hypothetical protein
MPVKRTKKEILDILRWRKKMSASCQETAEYFHCSKNSVSHWEKMYTIKELEQKLGELNKETVYAPSDEVKKSIDDAAIGMMELTKRTAYALNMYVDKVVNKLETGVSVKLTEITMVRNILQIAAPFALATKGNGSEKEVPVDKQSQFAKIEAQARLAIQEASKQTKNKGNAKRAI